MRDCSRPDCTWKGNMSSSLVRDDDDDDNDDDDAGVFLSISVISSFSGGSTGLGLHLAIKLAKV